MKKKYVLIVLCILFLSSLGCKKTLNPAKLCTVDIVIGSAVIEKNGKESPLKPGIVFGVNDVIKTGPKSAVISSFNDGSSQFEIQENALFKITEYGAAMKKLKLEKGNLWLKANKLTNEEELILDSHTAVASVRGTKFYTFKMGDIYGTCQCRGKTHYKVKGQDFDGIHETDRVVFTRGNQTVVLGPKDFPMFDSDNPDMHRHSMLENSPLGPKAAMTPEQYKKFISIVEKAFKKKSKE